MDYNKKAVDAIEPFNRQRKQVDLSFSDQRLLNGITNALTMLIEEKGWNEKVFDHLTKALLEFVSTLESHKLEFGIMLEKCLVEVRKHK